MAQGDRKVGSLSYKEGSTTYNVVSVWESAQYPGSYSLSRDKENGQYQAIGLIDALKGFVAGKGYINFRLAREQSERGGGSVQRPRSVRTREPQDDFADDDIPF